VYTIHVHPSRELIMTHMTRIESLAHWEIATITALLMVGAALFAVVLWSIPRIWKVPPGPVQNIRRMRRMIRCFRIFVLAAGTAGVGLGWLLDEPSLYWLAVVFCLEELWECFFLRHGLADIERIALEGHSS
jgi:hypothetical protein